MELEYERPMITQHGIGYKNPLAQKTEYFPISHIEGNKVSDLIERYGSPLFVISERKIRQNMRKALRCFESRYPKVQFGWSYKTNYMNAVCNVFHQEGSWAEVVSGYEYNKALLNGVPGDKIIFNGPDKSKADLTMAIKNASLIHIDHLDELYMIMDLAVALKQRPRVAIRVNMDTGIYPMWDRFGFNYENGAAWDVINKIIYSDKMDLEGLHCHIGTFMLSPEAYGVAASKLADLAVNIKSQHNKEIKYLDMGGGFASKNNLKGSFLPGVDSVPDMEQFAEAIANALLSANFDPNALPLLILETGRALIDDAGFLLGSVVANKRLADGRRATIMDFGVNLMFTSFWYNHKISPAQDFSQSLEETVLYGPLCMNIDCVRESVSLPPLNKGDQVVVHSVGAYNMTQWMQFIQLRPSIVLIDEKGVPHLIRESETVEYINQLEKTPKHLQKFTFK